MLLFAHKLVWFLVKKRFTGRGDANAISLFDSSHQHSMPQPDQLTHFDDQGSARMVSVSDKAATHRVAVVSGQVVMKQSTACLLYTSPSPRDQRGSRMPSSA